VGECVPSQNVINDTSVAHSSHKAKAKKDLGEWSGQGLGDIFAPKKPAARNFVRATEIQAKDDIGEIGDDRISRQRKLNDGFEGRSFGDVLQSARRESPKADSKDVRQHDKHEDVQEQRTHRKPAEDVWGGASLGDALIAKAKAAPTQPDSFKDVPRASNSKRAQIADHSGACQKSQQQIVEWLRSLPVSHLPEQPREGIVAIVEEKAMTGNSFTEFVQKVDPALCGPKHAMKLKAAWNNVLAEAAATEVCRQNLDYAANHSKKAVAMSC
jgi:hypothetical protein